MRTVADFTRRGRSDEKLTADFAAFLKRRGLRVEFEVPWNFRGERIIASPSRATAAHLNSQSKR
jgi:hypothetical protein